MNPKALLVLCFFLGPALQAPAAVGTSFTQAMNFGEQWYPREADLDDDGDLDIVALKNISPVGVLLTPVWLENHETTFSEHGFGLPGSTQWEYDLADYDGDGDIDLLTTFDQWLENNGARPPQFILHPLPERSANLVPNCIRAADVDRDGDNDLVIGYATADPEDDSGMLAFYESDGGHPPALTLRSFDLPFEPIPKRMALADLDGNGLLDAVLGTIGGLRTCLFTGPGRVADAVQQEINFYGQVIRGTVSACDLNGDGRPDVLTGTDWFENQPGSPITFSPRLLSTELTSGTYGESIAADMDHDGDLDVFGTPNLSYAGWVLYQAGNNGQTSPAFSVRPFGPNLIANAPGDLDGDGNRDILVNQVNNYGNGKPLRIGPPMIPERRYLYEYRNIAPRRPVTVLTANDTGRVNHAGGPLTIHWRTDLAAAGDTVVLELWRGTQTKIAWLATSHDAQGRGAVTVTLPQVPTGGDYRIRATCAADRSIDDFSDEAFIIRAQNSVSRHWVDYRDR